MESLKPGVRIGLGQFAENVPCCNDALAQGVWDMLQLGSPRLAYAIANGFPLVPYEFTVQAIFATQGTTLADQGNQEKIVWDVLIDDICFQVQNGITPSGLDSLTNWFFQYQSGIEARIKIIGAGGGYNPVPDYTPINLVARKIKRPWLLTCTNAIKMDFQATVTLPFSPVTVSFVFNGTTCYWPLLIDLPDVMAIKGLEKMGYVCGTFHQRYGCV